MEADDDPRKKRLEQGRDTAASTPTGGPRIMNQTSQHLRLQSAFLCVDCEAIVSSPTRCPACAGESLMPLAPVLNRWPEPPSRYMLAGTLRVQAPQ